MRLNAVELNVVEEKAMVIISLLSCRRLCLLGAQRQQLGQLSLFAMAQLLTDAQGLAGLNLVPLLLRNPNCICILRHHIAALHTPVYTHFSSQAMPSFANSSRMGLHASSVYGAQIPPPFIRMHGLPSSNSLVATPHGTPTSLAMLE